MSVTVPQAVVVSLPLRLAAYDAMALPASRFVPDQVLFGGDAQAAILMRLFEGSRVPAVLVPAPEIFHDATTFAAIERLLPDAWRAGDAPLSHLRFGPLKDCRLLKFSRNAHLLVEAANRREVRVAGNPFAARQAVPAALGRILRYGTSDDLVCIDGSRPESIDLPPALAAADMTAWAAPAPDPARAALAEIARDSLEILSFADYLEAKAEAGFPARPHAGPRPSIALPFNCADPASAIPEIVFSLARFPGPAESGIALTLLPYNTLDGEPRLDRLIGRVAMMLERREGALDRENLFVARVRRPLPAMVLRHLFPSAILDAGDPEFAFVEARLRALGIPALTYRPDEGMEEAGPVPPGRRLERFEDAQSPRLIEVARPSRIRCMELLAEAHAGLPAAVPLHPQPIDLRPILGGAA